MSTYFKMTNVFSTKVEKMQKLIDWKEVTSEVVVSKIYPEGRMGGDLLTLSSIVECYREVFESPPWDEWLKCPKCQKPLGSENLREIVASNYMHCGVPLVDFWPRHELIQDIKCEFGRKGSSCWRAVSNKFGLVGFCWGYPITTSELIKKLGIKVKKPQGLKDGLVAYQDEVGVLPHYRGLGIAKAMVAMRLNDFLAQGLTYGVTRTRKSPAPSQTYLWYIEKLGYEVIAEYPGGDGRVILGRKLEDLDNLFS